MNSPIAEKAQLLPMTFIVMVYLHVSYALHKCIELILTYFVYLLFFYFLLTVFPNVPAAPGLPCIGEDRNMYRRGARRWRKLYRVNGHLFQAKRFSRVMSLQVDF